MERGEIIDGGKEGVELIKGGMIKREGGRGHERREEG